MQQRVLVRARGLSAFRRALTDLAIEGAPLSARRRVVIVPTRAAKAVDLRKFVYWAVTRGQKFGPPLLFEPLPVTVQAFAFREIKKIQPAA